MEMLYNGIILSETWPPNNIDPASNEEMKVPYLENPPQIITIDIGRQLFVDEFLIESTTLKSKYHKAKKYEGNPILFAEMPWEKEESLPVACPKSGGVWWDNKDKIFKMWYEAGWLNQMAYAISKDGIHWERPELDIEPGTNKILVYDSNLGKNEQVLANGDVTYLRPDSTTVFIDDDCKDQNQRYKMFMRNPGGECPGIVMTSADGIHWENFRLTSPVYDRSTIFYNPFRKKWIYSIRSNWKGRTRNYREHSDFLEGALWTEDEEVKWLSTDEKDKPNPYIGFEPQLYNVDAIAYESIMIGMFQIMYGPENNVCEKAGIPKITELIPMYSRDGFHWSRPSRDSIIQASLYSGSWDRGYVQSVGGICVIMGDELWFYYIGFKGDESNTNTNWFKNGMYSNGATGIAKLRRDGFVSMSADAGGGVLLTRPIKFHNKKHMFVNLNGGLFVEILTVDGTLITKSIPVYGDDTKTLLKWENNFDIETLNGKPIRIKFNLMSGELYSFWFSDDNTGDSNGYLAAGAPLG